MSISRSMVVSVAFAVACADAPNSPSDDTPTGTLVDARTGGVVTSGDVSLIVPPGSLSEDTSIAIVSETAAPDAYTDGFAASGAAFRFTPAGTHFALDKPALLTMPFDEAALAAQGLDARTLQLAYFDEELGRYLSVGGEIDPVTRTVTAKIEHFTIYQPIAASLAAGNNAPTIAPQGTIPSVMRANAPIYFRAIIRDYDSGGSVAGAFLHYRVQQGAWRAVAMKPEATLDVFGVTLPASAALSTPQGEDLRYYFTAVDSLGAARTSAEIIVNDFASAYAPETLAIAPGNQNIAAGFERVFAVTAKDNLGATFSVVPETVTLSEAVGDTTTSTAGVTFKARRVGTSALTVGFGAQSASASVTVFNGALSSIEILDEHGMPFVGTPDVRTGVRIPLSALGHDAWGNTIVVNPGWYLTQLTGSISSDGVLDTLDARGSLRVNAEIGSVTGTQWFNVTERALSTVLPADGNVRRRLTELASRDGVPYAAILEGNPWAIRVKSFDGTNWIDHGGPTTTLDVDSIAMAASANRVQIAWAEGTHVYSAHLEGSTWIRDGGAIEVDQAFSERVYYGATRLSLVLDGDTPWLAWHEVVGGLANVYVARWTGSAWANVGGRVGGNNPTATPSLVVIDGKPHVAIAETKPSPDTIHVRVRSWSGLDWVLLGDQAQDAANPYQQTEAPALVRYNDKLTVAYRRWINSNDSVLDVRQWSGTSWTNIAEPIDFMPYWSQVQRISASSDNHHLYLGVSLIKSALDPTSQYQVLHHSPSRSYFTGDYGGPGMQPVQPWNNNIWERDIDVRMIGNALYFAYSLPPTYPTSYFEVIEAYR